MAAVQTNQFESLEVRESGRALKVQTDNPHLVSIGSGRLSTNVTWHPLPEGKVTLGTSPDVDIVLQGTGVQPKHCVIQNKGSVVTLHPLADMTTVDGLQVTSPVRLCQGNMLCIGRSNYLRFNHPAEANLMKQILPNTRISMAAPLNYFGNGDGFYEKKPPMPPSRRSRDSWGDLSNGSSEDSSSAVGGSSGGGSGKSSKFEIFTQGQGKHAKSISPKVFPPGSATVNSPASVVLGHSRIPNGLLLTSADVTRSRTTAFPDRDGDRENGSVDYIEPPVPQTISSYPQKPTVSSFPQQQNGFVSGHPDPDGGRVQSPKILSLPSPAFNRNPPYVPDKFRSITTAFATAHGSSGSTTVSPSGVKLSQDADLESGSTTMTTTTSRSQDEERIPPDQKLLQSHNEGRIEQKVQMLEKQRLDEILNMCAEYERQVQSERQTTTTTTTKAPTTPTLQQNRIKTNGSLPRDKRNNGLPSPLPASSDDEYNQVFTFDSSPTSPSKSRNCLYDNVRIVNGVPQTDSPSPNPRALYESSPRTDQYDVSSSSSLLSSSSLATSGRYGHVEFGLSPNPPDKLIPPQSPRTRIRTTVRDQAPRDPVDYGRQTSGFDDYDTADPIKYREPSPNVQNRRYLTPSQQLNKFSNLSSLVSANQPREEGGPGDRNKFILPLDQTRDLSDLMSTLEREFSATLSELRDVDNSLNGSRRDDSWANDELNNDLPESERDIHRTSTEVHAKDDDDDGGAENAAGEGSEQKSFLRQKKPSVDWGKLKVEKSTWLGIVTRIKSEINNLEQQEEEVLREMKMELALLNAEYLSEKEKQKSDEEKLTGLRDKQQQLDTEIEQCKRLHSEIQKDCNDRIQSLKAEMQELEETLGQDKDTSDEYKNLAEKVEAEKKSFEDVEFKHLEEEANWLATRDELQREMSEVTGRLDERRVRLTELEDQIRDIEKSSQNDSNSLDLQKVKLLQQLDEARTKMKELDIRLSAESSQDNYSGGEEGSPSLKDNLRSKRSQEDLVRISKVTSDAPIDVGKTGSLGRKTLESLKEIERNRQLHLAKQGSQVIEEERKRVEQLKRRVQDEVRAQWEQSRQRECNSLNSVGSEESNVTCSDQPTESASSDDIEKSLPGAILPGDPRNSADSYDKMRKESDASEFRNSRPISDYSGSEFEQQVNVKKREAKPARLIQQRPLTRYLPIKSESLNLRQHIESAGHQVDLCPHVSIDSTSCRGILHKLGGKFHHWNKRWFVFDRTRRTLLYYGDKSEKKQRGGTYFQAIEEVYVDHLNSVKSPNPHVTFVIKTHERTYYLMAPSPEAMRIWVDVIFTGAEGYQEFEHGS